MIRLVLALALLAAGCSRGPTDNSPQAACARQADNDPVVADIVRRGAGTEFYRWDNEKKLAQAKQDATTRCLRARGLAPRGGVERLKTS